VLYFDLTPWSVPWWLDISAAPDDAQRRDAPYESLPAGGVMVLDRWLRDGNRPNPANCPCAVSILEGTAFPAIGVVPSLRRIQAADDGEAVDERPITAWTQQRGTGLSDVVVNVVFSGGFGMGRQLSWKRMIASDLMSHSGRRPINANQVTF
jgi:hypothetical protein